MFTMAKMRALILCVCLTFTGVACWFNAGTLAPVTIERLHNIHVGTPPPNAQCCIRGAIQPCGYSCVTNPNCPGNVTTKSTCAKATCAAGDDNSLCTTPSAAVTAAATQCTTTGLDDNTGCPGGTSFCVVNKANINISANNGCNVGDSLCAVARKPASPCK
jgi:hypothetical protein